MWSTAQRWKKIYRCDFHAGLEVNNRSVRHGKQCLLAWSCAEEKDDHIIRKALDFEVEGQRKNGSPKRTWKQ